ncbi:MAG TPA: glycosyl transferase [Bacteroidales bacterium]|nr:glycosyl transferase [Bacteroidales bacterium]
MKFNKKLDLKNPETFNAKLQWLKLYNRKPEYIQLVDKYEVKKYIAETIGEEYLVPLLGVYNNFDEIDFDALPNQFVLKPNHTSGDIYICKDKSNIDYAKLAKLINMWLKRRYYWENREWPYKMVKPRIICENYKVDESGIELKDYKFGCFHGEVKYCIVCSSRTLSGGLKMDYYNMNWELMPLEHACCPNSGTLVPKPKYFDKMVNIASILSKDSIFIRIDFYETDKQLYLGELTLYPCSGYDKLVPESYDYLLGSWIVLKS